jgi:hypothetical protein
MLLGDLQRVERRIDHAHVRAGGLGAEQMRLRSGDAHHVAESSEDHARLQGDRDRVINPTQRNDTDRATWAVDHLNVGREQILNAVLENRVSVTATDLHDF